MKKKINALVIVTGLLVFAGLSGCGNKKEQTSSTESTTVTTTLPDKDRSGAKVELPEKAEKIVSLAPSTTQVIDDLGRKDDLIAVDSQSTLTTKGLDKLPQFDMMAVDAEKLIALKPEIVYVTDINQAGADSVWQQVEKAGITVVSIPTSSSIEDIALDVQFIADTLSEHEQGKTLVDTMNQEIEEVKAIGETIKKKKTVLFEISGLPEIYSFGSGVFLNQMLDYIGAENVLADQKGWLPVTEEAAIAANPDVILTNVNYMDDPVGEILSRNSWKNVTAVKDEAVYSIDNASSSLPNQHIVKALREMAKAVYPEGYKDLKDE